ncbi:MAG: hypothetical protein V1707_01220 [bacterium]
MTIPPLSQFLKTEYWFNVYPLPLKQLALYVNMTGIGFAVIAAIASALAGRWLEKKNSNRRWIKYCQRVESWGWAVAIVGFPLVFFASQGARLLGMRFWLGAWSLWAVIWLCFIAYEGLFTIPKEMKRSETEIIKNKYLPKRKD